MNICTSGMPGGININCLNHPAPITNIIITDPSVSFTAAQIKVMANWKEKIQEDLTVFIPSAILGYENTTDDPGINTTQTMHKILTKEGVPSGVFYIESNFCDWNQVMEVLKGSTYRMFTVHADGAIIGHKSKDSPDYKGFLCALNAVTKGLALPDAVENSFPIYANFKKLAEFKQQFAVVPDWSIDLELPSAMPLSISMSKVSATQATATVVVDLFERCGDPIVAAATADIDILESTLTDDTVASVTDNDGGNHSIAFTTAAAGQYIKFRIKDLTGTVVNALSNYLFIEF